VLDRLLSNFVIHLGDSERSGGVFKRPLSLGASVSSHEQSQLDDSMFFGYIVVRKLDLEISERLGMVPKYQTQ
jgi:hypothetical protein